MSKYVKLPNEKIVLVGKDGFISVQVETSLSEFVDNDLDGVLNLLSEQATGTKALRNIGYSVVGHQGNTLKLKVSGHIDAIEEAVEVEESELPMREFEAEVTRVGYGNRTFRLSARTEHEALDIADDDAGNHLYPEHTSEYFIEVQQVSA